MSTRIDCGADRSSRVRGSCCDRRAGGPRERAVTTTRLPVTFTTPCRCGCPRYTHGDGRACSTCGDGECRGYLPQRDYGDDQWRDADLEDDE
jgi:hypothetical protein